MTLVSFFHFDFEIGQIFRALDFIWYKIQDVWTKKSYTFRNTENSIC